MEDFVTLFDSGFLPQGLALYQSLERHCKEFRLWILCVDETAFAILKAMALPRVHPIDLASVETDELKSARAGRTIAEYCWTLTPFSIGVVFDIASDAQRVTYLDADIWFVGDPSPIFTELDRSGKAVLITEHAYAPDYDSSAQTGRYCVQFMTFRRNAGEQVRRWWGDRCIEWCYARIEDGKFGDQKYLDDWEVRFTTEVHRLRQAHLILAPWNAARFPYGGAVTYHFHGLRLLKDWKVLLTRGYEVPEVVIDAIYRPYLADLSVAIGMMAKVGHAPEVQGKRPNLAVLLGILFRKAQRSLARLKPVRYGRLPKRAEKWDR